MIRRPALVFLALSLLAPALGQSRQLTLEDIYHPQRRLDLGPPSPRLTWAQDGKHFVRRKLEETDAADGSRAWTEIELVDALDGSSRSLIRRENLATALAGFPGSDRDRVKMAGWSGSIAVSPDLKSALIRHSNDLYQYFIDSRRLRRLTENPAEEIEPAFSPDGEKVSFVRSNDLYVLDLERGTEKRLTRDGGEQILNGRLDWVYQEEIYGRGKFRAYWWSPDSRQLAFLRLDQTKVPSYNVVHHRPLHLRNEVIRYPKAGDPNALVKLGVVSSGGGETTWVDLSRYSDQEILIVRVGWTPNAERIHFQVQDRQQTWLHLNSAHPKSGRSSIWIRESSPAWVNVLGQPHWLEDGSFLWQSERTGWRHLYRYSGSGDPIGKVTSGDWEVRSLHGVKGRTVYFSATERSPIGLDLYRVGLDGAGLHRISREEGTHSVTFNQQLSLYIDRWSDIDTPPRTRLFNSEGKLHRIIEKNPVHLARFRLSKPTFHQVTTRDGFKMEALMIRPSDFDPARKYPVMSHAYSGPHAPRVRNSWGSRTYLWHQMLAQKGYIIWICDNRTASGKGAQSAWPLHRNFGELELADLEDGLAWLKTQSYIDGNRIGLWGWSFGGYMTSYALTHSRSFKVGIAGAPVTDWRLYDSVYTERYMGTPQSNPQGYKRSSALEAAGQLHGKLLIIHGVVDDNVHLQNTIQFVDALQKAGKQFELMVYPGSRHGVRDRKQVWHLRNLMTDFILKNL